MHLFMTNNHLVKFILPNGIFILLVGCAVPTPQSTSTPTLTPLMPTITNSATLAPTLTTTPTPTNTPTQTSTPTPKSTDTPTPKALVVKNADQMYVFIGPGANYALLGIYTKGFELEVVGRNEEANWVVIIIPPEQQGWVSIPSTQSSTPSPSPHPSLTITNTPFPTASPTQSPTSIPTLSDTPSPSPMTLQVNLAQVKDILVSVHSGPDLIFPEIANFSNGLILEIDGSNLERTWLLVRIADHQNGWINIEDVNITDNLSDIQTFESPPTPVIIPTPVESPRIFITKAKLNYNNFVCWPPRCIPYNIELRSFKPFEFVTFQIVDPSNGRIILTRGIKMNSKGGYSFDYLYDDVITTPNEYLITATGSGGSICSINYQFRN